MAASTDNSRPSGVPWWMACAVLLSVWVSFLAYSAWRAPVPAVNEPHYLTKAKHFWDPTFCPNDFFLNSANAHYVFYLTNGWLTQWLSLSAVAWIGRVVSLGVLAWGWRALVTALVPSAWAPLWAAWAFLACQATGNLSGEWVVGGVEAKVYTYGLMFAAVGLGLRGRLFAAALCMGGAISFHPVVGLWGLIGGAFATLVQRFRQQDSAEPRPSRPRLAVAAALLVLSALPGLIPALQLLGAASPEVAETATHIQVFQRLRHHLDPMVFAPQAYAAYGLLLLVWLTCRHRIGLGDRERWFAAFVLGSVLVAVVGVALGWRNGNPEEMPAYTLRMSLLKFYPFRLADALLPVAAAVTLAARLPEWFHTQPRSWILCAALFGYALAVPSIDRNPSRMEPTRRADWLAVCDWIREHTPPDSLFYIHGGQWAFKWHAQRAEYVSSKDFPQDAASIVEWNQRREESLQHVVSRPDYGGVTHVLVESGRSFVAEPLYERGDYKVFRLEDLFVSE